MDDAPKLVKFEAEARRAGQPAAAEEGRLRRADPAERAFTIIAKSALAQISTNVALLRDARRLEAVHQARVGLRRLRAAFGLFEPMLAGPGFDHLRGELKWMGGELNDARNLDVFIADRFRPAARAQHDWPDMAAYGKALLHAQTKAYDRAQTAARSARFGVLMLEAIAWVDQGDWRGNAAAAELRGRRATDLAAEVLDAAHAQVLKRGRKLKGLDEAERHKLRIRAKRLRYAAAFFADLYADRKAKAHARFLASVRELQDALGHLTDIATAMQLSAEIAGAREAPPVLAEPAAAFAAGLIVGQLNTAESQVLRAAVRAFEGFRQVEAFW